MSPTRPIIADTTTMTAGGPEARPSAAAVIPALRKAAILVVSLEQKMASMLLAQLDRAEVEAVTLEIARLDRIDPEEQRSVLEEFYGLGVRRMRFVFDDVARLDPADLRTAYRDEDARTWALALAGISHAAQGRVLAALDPGDARRLEAMLAALGPFRLKDAEAAQADLADLLRGLHDRGRLTLPAPVEAGAVLV